jgi:hypothetical protein
MMDWTAEEIGQVFALAEAKNSMSVIAKQIGRSRSAVIGVYYRERQKRGTLPPVTPRKRVLQALEGTTPVCILPEERAHPVPYRDTVDKAGGGRMMPLPTLPATGVGMILPVISVDVPQGPAVGILDVTGCRWPVGEDAAVPGRHTFCNGPQRDGSSYCAEHSKARVAEGSRETIRQTIRSSLHLVRKARAA